MWSDNETNVDFLNFSAVADTAAEFILSANDRPISIGVSGAWGIGKSSMIRLIEQSLADKQTAGGGKFVYVRFNAWLYQGYDDARAALVEEITSELEKAATSNKGVTDKVRDLGKRINWLRVAKSAAHTALPMALGLPPVGLLAEVHQLGKKLNDGGEATAADGELLQKMVSGAGGFVSSAESDSPPKAIEKIRATFSEILEELGVTLVVLIDDLDRCLPSTAISTLEAMRLFLFLERTAFVIAADNQMIKHAVRQHFGGGGDLAENMVTSYFDKLIQVPIKVPPLSVQDVRAYLFLLHVENSSLESSVREKIRRDILGCLKESWKGGRVERSLVEKNLPDSGDYQQLKNRLASAERLAPLLTIAPNLNGNPRLIKRFLNALAIRSSIAKMQGVDVDEELLAKLHLLERCGSADCHQQLLEWVGSSNDGKATELGVLEKDMADGKELSQPWDSDFAKQWLLLEPSFATQDLRGALYVSREQAPLISSEESMSDEAQDFLRAVLDDPASTARVLKSTDAKFSKHDLSLIGDKICAALERNGASHCVPLVSACTAIADKAELVRPRVLQALQSLSVDELSASVAPKLGVYSWCKSVLQSWSAQEGNTQLKNAASRALKG